MVEFRMEKVMDERTGTPIDTVVKYTYDDSGQPTKENWCSVIDLDELFSTCVVRWGDNWDLNKVKVAITESEID